MKKTLALFLVVSLLLAGSAAAEDIDLSGLSFDQLVALRDRLNLAIWNCQEWQEVTVPAGVWVIGEDIPAGHWSITPADPEKFNVVYYTDILDSAGKSVGIGWDGWMGIFTDDSNTADLDMKAGMYFISETPMIFTPWTGKPDLGFH